MSFFDHFAAAQSQSDFAISITDSDWNSDWPSLVSKQTVKVEVNFVARKLVFHLRQTAKGVIQDVIFHILEKETKKIDHICITPGKKTGQYEYHFKNGEVIDHHCQFSYDSSDDMVHILTVEFHEVELKTPASSTRKSVKITADDNGPQQING